MDWSPKISRTAAPAPGHGSRSGSDRARQPGATATSSSHRTRSGPASHYRIDETYAWRMRMQRFAPDCDRQPFTKDLL